VAAVPASHTGVFLKDVLQDVERPAGKTGRKPAGRKPAATTSTSRAAATKTGAARTTSSRTRRAG